METQPGTTGPEQPRTMNVVILPPVYLPTAEWFADLERADLAVVDTAMRHDKRRKLTHRAVVEGPQGPFLLTVPVYLLPIAEPAAGEPRRHRTWADVAVSAHGHWWTVHSGAIESAYSATPYFEHYWPLLRDYFTEEAVGEVLTLYTSRLHTALRTLLGVTTPVSATLPARLPAHARVTDLRRKDYPGETVLGPLFRLGPSALA